MQMDFGFPIPEGYIVKFVAYITKNGNAYMQKHMANVHFQSWLKSIVSIF